MKRIVFHTFQLGDVEDPEIYAAEPMFKWQDTEQGRWAMEHCANPLYRITPDFNTFGYRVDIYGELEDKQAVEYLLRWNREQS